LTSACASHAGPEDHRSRGLQVWRPMAFSWAAVRSWMVNISPAKEAIAKRVSHDLCVRQGHVLSLASAPPRAKLWCPAACREAPRSSAIRRPNRWRRLGSADDLRP
jgi:hypothetical protein